MSTIAHIPDEIATGFARWQALRNGRWVLTEAQAVRDGLLLATKTAYENGYEALTRALSELALCVGILADSEASEPSPAQMQKLDGLEAQVLTAMGEQRAAPDSEPVAALAAPMPRKRVLVLAPEIPIWGELVDRLRAGQQVVETCTDSEQLLKSLHQPGLIAVLIDQEFLMDLGTVADQLEGDRGAEALGATVIYFNRSRDPESRELALSAGADSSLEGDEADHLLARVEELIGVRSPQANLRVLVFEDDRSQAMYCEAVLRKQGVNVCIASSTRNALDDIRRFAPDLILMDLHMPEINGVQLTAMIRDEADLALLPIVFLTGEESEGSRYDALRAGGDDYLTKPIRPRHLVTAVVTRARRARNLSKQVSQLQDRARRRLVHTGEMIAMLRNLGVDRPSDHVLMLCAADSGKLCKDSVHLAVEKERQYNLATQLKVSLGAEERIASWRGDGWLMLMDWLADEELMVRATQIRELARDSLAALGGGDFSVAIVPLKGDSLPSAETMLDLAERTIAVARHAGGKSVRLALAETQSDLSAEVSLAIQKTLTIEPSGESTSLLFQPIVPLHGAGRPQYHAHLGLRVNIGGERVITRRQWASLARQTGRVNAFDQYTVAQVLAKIAEMRPKLPGLRVVVACAAESLLDTGFRKHLIDQLALHALNDPGLILSIDHSEAMLMQNRLQEARDDLRAARVLLGFGRVRLDAKDDETIRIFRPEIISVDAAAVKASQQVPPILGFARDHGAEILVHFIPDPQTLARLFAMGVDYGMGGFIGLPNPRMDYDFGELQF
jgi:CheY-like chemotaxis protein/EAL domain-containing protein (putative c-di-GMP-specific phosphodiesterase class I)